MNAEPLPMRLERLPASGRRIDADPRVIDEAFAAVTDADLRRDARHASERGREGLGAELATLLRAQLAALEGQRRELARLLGD